MLQRLFVWWYVITVPVQKAEWVLSEPNSANRAQKYEGINSIDLHEGQVRRFVCHVNGSFPEPEVVQLAKTTIVHMHLMICLLLINQHENLSNFLSEIKFN